jgi:uncharacterized membrane protein YfcA
MPLVGAMICVGVIFVASILQTSVGMGFGMIASPLIAVVSPELVPASIMLTGLLVSSTAAYSERKSIILAELKAGIGGRCVGGILACIVLLTISDLKTFMLIFGSVMLVAILMAASTLSFSFSLTKLFNLSIVSGLMGTITAVGAPPMALIYHDRPGEIVRPTLNAFFAFSCVIGLVVLAISGWLNLQHVMAMLLFLPPMIAGIFVARFFRNLPKEILSKILLLISGIASLMLIYRGLV